MIDHGLIDLSFRIRKGKHKGLHSVWIEPDIRSLILPPTALAAENLAPRQQLAILNRKIHRPQLHRRDQFFWAPLATPKNSENELLIAEMEFSKPTPQFGTLSKLNAGDPVICRQTFSSEST